MVCEQTALHLAVLTDQADIVHQLLLCGADVNVVDDRGQTCLHTAVLLDTTKCLRRLLSARQVNLNALSYDGTYLCLSVSLSLCLSVCLCVGGSVVRTLDLATYHLGFNSRSRLCPVFF